MTIKPTRVTTIGRGSNWGYRVLGANGEVLASRWHFRSDQAARQAGVAASLAISTTSITMSNGPHRIERSLQRLQQPARKFASWE